MECCVERKCKQNHLQRNCVCSSRPHVMMFFMQSGVSQSSEPRPILACEQLRLSGGCPFHTQSPINLFACGMLNNNFASPCPNLFKVRRRHQNHNKHIFTKRRYIYIELVR